MPHPENPQPTPAQDGPNSTPGVPKWKGLERKDVLLRPDQVEDLTALRRRLQRQQTDRSERLTNNTLIRVAVDLLIGYQHRLTDSPTPVDNEEQALAAAVRQPVPRPLTQTLTRPPATTPDTGPA
ncbi:hypothetical protein STHAL_33515 [Streptomyces halstedii]|uniref:Uncharacterized protein n=1 Tax=Streptomyces halstedii TaxID=1944 RepID=A0ABS6U1G7_STRHA|nr:hypothetical protein [Streptomyces halstedii]MBV7674365.1 hypothetical protein [Streptomyces halstedii]